jgi:hypothetical protein
MLYVSQKKFSKYFRQNDDMYLPLFNACEVVRITIDVPNWALGLIITNDALLLFHVKSVEKWIQILFSLGIYHDNLENNMRYLSEIISYRNRMARILTTEDVILVSDMAHGFNSRSIREQFIEAMDSIDSLIDTICRDLKIPVTKVSEECENIEIEIFTMSFDLDPDVAKLLSFVAATSNQSKISKAKREYMKSLESLIIGLSPLSKNSRHPITQETLKLVFNTSSSLLPTDRIILLSQLFDELFGYGPLGPFRVAYGDIQLNLDGTFSAGDKSLNVQFDSQEHRKEILALFKIENKDIADDGFVEYGLSNSTKFRVPASVVPEIETSLTRFEKLGIRFDYFDYLDKRLQKDSPLKLKEDFCHWL